MGCWARISSVSRCVARLFLTCTPPSKWVFSYRFKFTIQTFSYLRHFISTCIRVCGYESTSRGIDVEGHVTAAMHCPVGADADRVARDM